MSHDFTPAQTRRYSRHLVLKGMGGAGQQALARARVLVVGAGGLGSPVIAYLAAAGVGTIGVVDHDAVSLSNLQRQIIHRTDAVGDNKAESAARFAQALNPEITVDAHATRLDETNAESLITAHDLVLDGSDSLQTRRLVATTAEALGKPLVSGAVSMWDGQVTVFVSGGPRFSDLYAPEADDADLPGCEVTGVLGPLTGVIGTLMATEAVKLITGIGTPLIGRVLLYNSRDGQFTELRY